MSGKYAPQYLLYGEIVCPCFHAAVPGSVQAAVRALLDAGDYLGPLRKTLVAGGCNCSRGSFIGACMGAKYGLSSIPMEWLEKTDSAKHALELAIQLAQLP